MRPWNRTSTPRTLGGGRTRISDPAPSPGSLRRQRGTSGRGRVIPRRQSRQRRRALRKRRGARRRRGAATGRRESSPRIILPPPRRGTTMPKEMPAPPLQAFHGTAHQKVQPQAVPEVVRKDDRRIGKGHGVRIHSDNRPGRGYSCEKDAGIGRRVRTAVGEGAEV